MKKLAIVSYSLDTVNMYCEQMKSLFMDNLIIEKHCIQSAENLEEITADIVLLISYDVFEIIKKKIKKDSHIVFGNRTISKSGMDKIMSIPSGTEVALLDESLEMSKQMISVLYQIGVKHINLIPCSPECVDDFKEKAIIVLGYTIHGPYTSKELINIGSSLLDISTIIDIGIRLNLDHILNRQNIRKSYKEMVTADIGLAEILGKINRFESQLDILLQVIDDGVIGINSYGQVFSYNDNAKRILGLKTEEVNGQDGIKLLSMIPFQNVLDSCHPIKEKLIKINGNDIVVSVDPIIHSGKLYGAAAIIKEFSEAERKQHKLRAQLIGKGHKAKYRLSDIVGKSEEINKCKEIAKRMANSNSSILITGESGTGKEMFAQAIHQSSNRRDFQFVAVNCGALPESLLESELFGYEEGAFTGARRGGKPGLFELAHRGTLFLDEIGEMPANLQNRILRVIQEREVMRIGGDRLINVDIRLISASNRNLKEMIHKGEFREDLYYRLNVLPLTIPPLRSRLDDILPLIDEFKKEFHADFNLTKDAKKAFLKHHWKGNVRELRNYVEYIVNLGKEEIDRKDLPFEYEGHLEDSFNKTEDKTVEEFFKNTGKKFNKYLFVLEQLEVGRYLNQRLGRRSIFQLAREKGIFISEQEIRNILIDLEELGLVDIFQGRGGTIITEVGRNILSSLSTMSVSQQYKIRG
ncbi:MAG: sigma 54-interacting transcriptional regulator [Bacillota bacterium]